VPGLIDEIPILAVAAAAAEGTTCSVTPPSCGSRRAIGWKSMAAGLTALGISVETQPDGLVVNGLGGRTFGGRPVGDRPLVGGSAGTAVDSCGDHRIALALAIAGLAAVGRTVRSRMGGGGHQLSELREDLHRCTS